METHKREIEKDGTKNFIYSPDCKIPQIPNAQDVLYKLELSEEVEDDAYTWCQSNHEPYVINVHRAVVAVSFKVMGMRYSAAEARPIIARAIIDLCPEPAKCLFNQAFVNAKKLAGEDVPPLSVGRDVLQATCTCKKCQEIIREENTREQLSTD